MAVLLGVRRRPHLRGRLARPRPALRAGERLRRHHASQAGGAGGNLGRARRATASSASARTPRSTSARCIGPSAAARCLVAPDPESTKWCLTLYEAPMRPPEGFSITLSPFRKPSMECMPVDAKAGCLYPNNARALIEANARGFGNCAVRDHRRQYRRARHRQSLHRQGRRGVHAGAQRHLLERHHPPARDQTTARGRRQRGGNHAAIFATCKTPTRFSPPAIIPR